MRWLMVTAIFVFCSCDPAVTTTMTIRGKKEWIPNRPCVEQAVAPLIGQQVGPTDRIEHVSDQTFWSLHLYNHQIPGADRTKHLVVVLSDRPQGSSLEVTAVQVGWFKESDQVRRAVERDARKLLETIVQRCPAMEAQEAKVECVHTERAQTMSCVSP